MSDRPTLPDPISGALAPTDPAAVERVWRAVKAQRDRRGSLMRERVTFALIGAASAIAVTFAISPKGARLEPRPLELASGLGLEANALSSASRAIETAFADGSSIRASKGSGLAVLVNDGRDLRFLLERGELEVEVHPGGPRQWIFETSLARVEVLGTHFRIEASAERFGLEVTRGAVFVRSDRLSSKVKTVGAGERLALSAASVAANPIPPPPNEVAAPVVEAVRPDVRSVRPDVRSASRAGRRAEVSAPATPPPEEVSEGASAAAKPDEQRPPPPTVAEDSIDAAEVLEKNGHAGRARAMLARMARDEGDRASAALAAFELGRLEQDAGNPREAALALERALVIGLPSALRGHAMARIVEAYEAAGQPSEAARWRSRTEGAEPRP
ncbi:MAG: FecR domain-containing protein [Deltaproteobacteria bacterium]|nr:FecR domain-containing protein [Deltaproteobacteria bacterium]